jgi:hypothetical protein
LVIERVAAIDVAKAADKIVCAAAQQDGSPVQPGVGPTRTHRRRHRTRRTATLGRAYRIDDGIPVLLIDEGRDVDDDEHARLMERGRPANPQ